LAAVLSHELVGHGTQHLYDRFENMRLVEIECEANLFQEQVYQDLKFDKMSNDMIKFRKRLEGWAGVDGHCSDFKRFVEKNSPSLMTLWEQLNPDVPKLLVVLEDFMKSLRDKGVAVAVASANKEELFRHGPPGRQYQMAINYLRGRAGVAKNLKTAASWFYRAAQGGYGPAQFSLGMMIGNGTGVSQNLVKAHFWLNLAGSKGLHQAVENKIKLEKSMLPNQIAEAKKLLLLWEKRQSTRNQKN
jgi:hypothetical protein